LSDQFLLSICDAVYFDTQLVSVGLRFSVVAVVDLLDGTLLNLKE